MTTQYPWIIFAVACFVFATGALVLESALIRAREDCDRLRRELDKSTWTTHEFEIVLDSADDLTDLPDELVDRIYEADCADGTVRSREGRVYVSFCRLAPTLRRAIEWAKHDIRKAGYTPGIITD